MRPTLCSKKTELLAAYSQATKVYAQSVSEMTVKLGKIDKAEYEELRQMAERFREACDRTGELLDRHVDEHGC